jgi:hypothetical protein
MPGRVDPLPASTAFPCRMVNKPLPCRNDAKMSRLHAGVSRIGMGASRLHAPTSSSYLPMSDLWAAMSSSWAVINDLWAAMSDSWAVINDLWTAMSSLSLPISDSYAPINHFPVPPDCLRVSQNHSPVPASRPRRMDYQRDGGQCSRSLAERVGVRTWNKFTSAAGAKSCSVGL